MQKQGGSVFAEPPCCKFKGEALIFLLALDIAVQSGEVGRGEKTVAVHVAVHNALSSDAAGAHGIGRRKGEVGGIDEAVAVDVAGNG